MDTTKHAPTNFSKLAQLLEEDGILTSTAGEGNPQVTGAACDSRDVRAGNIFCCKGVAFRPEFLSKALEAGATCYLCDEEHAAELAETAPGTPALVSSNVRRAMGLVSAEAWGHPDRDVRIAGITGTKGKSTVAYMLRGMIDGNEPYEHTGVMGSIDTYDGIESFESHNTTPEAPELWRHLANVREKGLGHMVMEVSSQGLKYDRVLDLHLDVAVFLNIGRDHISPIEHPDFEDYFASKLRIFEQAKVAVVNLDTDERERVLKAAEACERLVTFSSTDSSADYWASNIEPGFGFIRFDAHGPSWEMPVTVGMSGLFNVDNALAALAAADILGINRMQAADALATARVPGRMEIVAASTEQVVGIVDYAHNKLSFQRFFSSMAKEFPGRQLIAVFGAAGDKAKERRVELPQEAAKWCDLLIYTEEDPAHERVADICAEMAAATPEGQDYLVIEDREKAIEHAVDVAIESGKPSLVCLLAKGDETRQHVGDEYPEMVPDGDVFTRAMYRHLTKE